MLRFALFVVLLPLVSADCSAARNSGDNSCGSAGQKFFFDSKTKLCQPFYYKGCNGNDNRFDSRDECLKTCKDQKASSAPSGIQRCAAGNPVAVDENNSPLACSACPKGYKCEKDVCCATKELTCNQDYDAGKFATNGKHTPMYFWNKQFNACMIFTYFGALGNSNNFATHNECIHFCQK